uniref:Uncharacterized protein n=1 Tax=Daphnia magna TaxID=35525 RepID=A0A0P6BRM8_9CRUS
MSRRQKKMYICFTPDVILFTIGFTHPNYRINSPHPPNPQMKKKIITCLFPSTNLPIKKTLRLLIFAVLS